MRFDQRKVRYFYWLSSGFVKKNIQPILLSFLLSLLGVIIVVSFAPYIFNLLTAKKEIIGISGTYSIDDLPTEILAKFSNGLLYINDKGELIPLLADSWEPVDNGKEYRFHIKKDLVWNDGKPFTAKDINYSFKDVEMIQDGDYLLRFKLKKPLAIFPNFLTKPIVKYPLVGVAGTYRVDRLKIKDGNIRLLQLAPNQKGESVLIYKFYDTDNKLIQAYKLGEITQMTTGRSNIADLFKNWKNTKVEKLVNYSNVMTLFFNLKDPFLSEDKDIRRAIAESIDKTKLADLGEDAYSPIPPTSWAHDKNIKKYSYNPSVSSKIIDKYVSATQSAEIKISTYYDQLGLADLIKEGINNIGLQSKVVVLSGSKPTDEYQVLLAQMNLGKDPDQYFFGTLFNRRVI